MELRKFDGIDVGYNEELKAEFGATAKAFARELLKYLHLREFDIRWNTGGIAGSGEVVLAGMYANNQGVYILISTPSYHGIMFRTISHMKDYTGGHNQWFRLKDFVSERQIAEHIRRNTFTGGINDNQAEVNQASW